MSFDLIPAELILQIFRHLSFKDRVRLSGVNRLFRDVSKKSIAKMKSLVVDEDLMAYYSVSTLPFLSLLESCSPILESIDVSNRCSTPFINASLAEFVYPKLEHLKITVPNYGNGQIFKRLISRCPNLRSIVLNLDCRFEWPEDIVFEKMEKLEIQVWRDDVDLSPTLRPLIGNIPNLKSLTIKRALVSSEHGVLRLTLSAEEFTQLMASTPSLEELILDLSGTIYFICRDFVNAIPTWRLPKLIALYVGSNYPDILSPILRHFPASFPRLESFKLEKIYEIEDEDIVALSQLKYLQELRLPDLEITNDKFTQMIGALPSIIFLEINTVNDQSLQALSQLKQLRELCLSDTGMTMAQIIDMVTSLPSIFTLGIRGISDVSSPQTLIDFLSSTAAIFCRDLEMIVAAYGAGSDWGLERVLEEMKAGPAVTIERHKEDVNYVIISIRYKSLDG